NGTCSAGLKPRAEGLCPFGTAAAASNPLSCSLGQKLHPESDPAFGKIANSTKLALMGASPEPAKKRMENIFACDSITNAVFNQLRGHERGVVPRPVWVRFLTARIHGITFGIQVAYLTIIIRFDARHFANAAAVSCAKSSYRRGAW